MEAVKTVVSKHNPKVTGSSPVLATKRGKLLKFSNLPLFFFALFYKIKKIFLLFFKNSETQKALYMYKKLTITVFYTLKINNIK
jgi:hypothetical protein